MPWNDTPCQIGKRTHRAHLRDKFESLLNRKLHPHEVVMHLCNEKRCNNMLHLEIGSASQNTLYARACGRFTQGWKPGEHHHNARLSKENVLSVRAMHANGIMQKTIAEVFKIHPSAISRILNGKRWKNAVFSN